ncbi:MAG: tetratricopeptide repeat protein [Planctomycetota bacterium]
MQVGPYRIGQEIARGANGVVYRAQDAEGQPVALKLLHAHRADDPRSRRRFVTEVQALARLQHPGLVAILGAGEHEGIPWLALAYVEGESLQDRLRRGPLPVGQALDVVRQVAAALAYVHACGVLHRDLKPDNVLLSGERALLADFGLARDDDMDVSRITRSGQYLGTPGYWPPEQARGRLAEIGERSDVYGLGGLLYACLTGRPPIEAPTLGEYVALTLRGAIDPPSATRPGVPAWLDALCMRCLALEARDRPASAEAVARALVTEPERAARAERRRPWVLLALAAALALGSVALAVVLYVRATTVSEEEAAAAAALVASAREHLAGGQADEALADLERALALDPQASAAYAVRARLRREAGELEQARADLARAQALGPRDAAGWRELGLELARSGDPGAALAALGRAVELAPEDPHAWVARAEVEGAGGTWTEAQPDLERALALAPQDLEVRARYVACLLAQDQAQAALDALGPGLEADPAWAAGYRLRGQARAALGEPGEAYADFARALELAPEDWETYAARGRVRLGRGQTFEALQDYDRVAELAPGAAAHLERAEVLFGLARHQAAIQAYGAALAADPGEVAALLGRARVYTALNLHEKAQADLARALELHPRDVALRLAHAELALRRGDAGEALASYRRAAEQAPTSAPAQAGLGLALLAQGDAAGALSAADAALALDPEQAAAHFARGQALRGLDRDPEALAELEAAARLAPKRAAHHAALGALQRALGDLEAAERAYGEAIRLAPSDPDPSRARATLRAARRQPMLAVRDYDRLIRLGAATAADRLARGGCAFAAGDFDDALADYRAAATLDPQDPEAPNLEGVVLARLERFGEAVGAYTRSLELAPGAQTYRNRAEAWSAQRQHAEAAADFTRALELEPQDARAWARLGECELDLGRPAEALARFERALELEPDQTRALEGRAEAYARLMRVNDALAVYARLIELHPHEVRYRVDRAGILWLTRPEVAHRDLQYAFLSGKVGEDRELALHLLSMLERGALERVADGAVQRYRVVGPLAAREARVKGEGLTLTQAADGVFEVRAASPGAVGRLLPYQLEVDLEGGKRVAARAALLVTPWTVRVFASGGDPQLETEAWQARGQERGLAFEVDELRLVYGNAGPSQLAQAPPAVVEADLPRDGFGTLATVRLSLAAGRYRAETLSDDGLRVFVDDRLVIDEWNHHPPTRHTGEFVLDAPREVQVRVEHFELHGYAVLEFDLWQLE